jgi:hypothetical protein
VLDEFVDLEAEGINGDVNGRNPPSWKQISKCEERFEERDRKRGLD